MRTILSLFVFLSSLAMSAQTTVAEGNIWSYVDVGYDMAEGTPYEKNPVKYLNFTKLYFNGSVVINGKRYLNLWETEARSTDDGYNSITDFEELTPKFVVCLREENSKVYVNKEQFNEMLKANAANSAVNFKPEDVFESEGDEYILIEPYGNMHDLYVNNNVNIWNSSIPSSISNLYNMLHFFPGSHWLLDGVWRNMFLNLFYRDGKLEYKSPNFYPDPFFPEEIADGIEEIVKNEKLKTERAVFNLQGQRINGLQKGLNIQDGKKIYIK